MTREQWTRIVDLFGAVADLPAALRLEWLTSECRDEPGLRREVEALLRADAAAGGGAFIRRAVAVGMADLGVRATAGRAENFGRPRADAPDA